MAARLRVCGCIRGRAEYKLSLTTVTRLWAWALGRQTADKSEENRFAEAIAVDRRGNRRSDRSHFDEGRLRPGEHQQDRARGRRQHRLALSVLSQQGGGGRRSHRTPH